MVDHLLVTEPGLFSTLQDFGRFGYQRYGISASGAMDRGSMTIANALAGNPPETVVVEVTLTGISVTVEADGLSLAFTGADFPLWLNGRSAEPYRTYHLERGDRIAIGAARSGMRGYLAIHGGFDLPPTLGSLSTHSRSGIGGFEGRALKAGDRLPLRAGPSAAPCLALEPALRPNWERPLRVVLGPQDDAFTAAGIETFLTSAYEVSRLADRMGCQLEGPAIAHAAGFNIVSDGITNGSIQVPGNGRPIVLLADRQTTGGYPKIATVIGADLPVLGQRRPGEKVRFIRIEAEEAEAIARAEDERMKTLLASLRPVADRHGPGPERLLAANLISGVCSAWHDPGGDDGN